MERKHGRPCLGPRCVYVFACSLYTCVTFSQNRFALINSREGGKRIAGDSSGRTTREQTRRRVVFVKSKSAVHDQHRS